MSTKPSPILLTWEMPAGLWVTSFRSTGGSNSNAYQRSREYRLPRSIVQSTDYDPPRIHLLTSSPVDTEHAGWSCDGQWEWHDSPIGARRRLFQRMLSTHFNGKNRERIGRHWVIEGPEEVTGDDGDVSNVWICTDFQYTDIEGKDGIVIDISRKVQAAQSLWEELEDGIHAINDGTRIVRVKVAVADDPTKMASRYFLRVTDMDLNAPAWEDSNITVAEYWAQNGHPYTEEEASQIPIVLVGSEHKPTRYPADKVFRVMSMDQWSNAVRRHLTKYLNLRPEKYLSLVRQGMGWLRGWMMKDHSNGSEWNLGRGVNFGWDEDLHVQHVDSRTNLRLPDGRPFLNHRWRWFNHVSSFERLHGRPPPSIDAHYLVPVGDEGHYDSLVTHAKEIFDQIPGWLDRVEHHELKSIPDDSRAKADHFIEQFISDIQNPSRSVVVFTALPPKNKRTAVDLYGCIKYALDEVGIIHQNFAAYSKTRLVKPADSLTGKVNVLQMLLKHGILPVPYTCEIGDIDIISAIDVGRVGANESVTAFAVAITRSGKLWGATPKAEPQKGESISDSAIRRTIKSLIARFEQYEGRMPKRILIMRDGNTPKRELMRLRKIVNEYREMGVDVCWISVRKSGAPRLLNFDDGGIVDELPTKGNWLGYSERSAWIWTTGAPELRPGRPGIPQGSAFTIELNYYENPLSLEDASTLLISHAHASQSQPWNSTRLPFVHHLADKMAKAMANGVIPLDQNGHRLSAI